MFLLAYLQDEEDIQNSPVLAEPILQINDVKIPKTGYITEPSNEIFSIPAHIQRIIPDTWVISTTDGEIYHYRYGFYFSIEDNSSYGCNVLTFDAGGIYIKRIA